MEYDHSRKAGNQGDVWKHAMLLSLAGEVPAPSDTFHYVESHCGAPVHSLKPGGEWEHGVGRVVRDGACEADYCTVAREWIRKNRYPAGWVFVTNRLAQRFKSVQVCLTDLSENVAAQYPASAGLFLPSVNITFQKKEGFALAAGLKRADLVFLDPPFHPDAVSDWRTLGTTCLKLETTGIPFVAWYPISWPTRPQVLVDTVECEAWEMQWAKFGAKHSQNLKGCGMVVSGNLPPMSDDTHQELQRLAACLGAEIKVRRPMAAGARDQ